MPKIQMLSPATNEMNMAVKPIITEYRDASPTTPRAFRQYRIRSLAAPSHLRGPNVAHDPGPITGLRFSGCSNYLSLSFHPD